VQTSVLRVELVVEMMVVPRAATAAMAERQAAQTQSRTESRPLCARAALVAAESVRRVLAHGLYGRIAAASRLVGAASARAGRFLPWTWRTRQNASMRLLEMMMVAQLGWKVVSQMPSVMPPVVPSAVATLYAKQIS
jgi:hypothetical protein